MKFKFSDFAIAVIILMVVLLIIIPLPTLLLDVFIVINITVALIILLTTLYTKEALEFSTFPPLLLIVTIFRLALNISSTRLILGNGGDAGSVIRTFGHFVIGDNIVVGVVIFLIIIIIQFVVITKGSERVAEVAARFTLDAMPGKQMSIDADLNTGAINDRQAKERRDKIQQEADFYGSMDGASKFVKGDAILSILITIVNIVGGIILGMVQGNMEIGEVIEVYTLATVGDGLVSQIPALLISVATGIIVTRAASENNLGKDLVGQISGQPLVLFIAGASILILSLIPGLPKLPMFVVGAGLITMAIILFIVAGRQQPEELMQEERLESAAQEVRKPESVISMLHMDLIEMEFGYSIIPLVDAKRGGDLLDRVVMIRRQCASELGVIVPSIRLRDNIQLESGEYVVKIKGVEVARGSIMVEHYLAMNSSNSDEKIKGIPTKDPAFGLPALWINESEKDKAEMYGYTIVDPPSVIATHLMEIVKRYSYELMGRQQIQTIIDNLKESYPSLVEDVIPNIVSLGEVQKVVGNLLKEGVSVRDMVTILETMGDYGTMTHDIVLLTEYVRQGLKRAITEKFIPNKKAQVITLDPSVEQLIADSIQQSSQGTYLAIEPSVSRSIFMSLKKCIEKVTAFGVQPIILTSAQIRPHFKKLTEQVSSDLIVLSYNEIDRGVELETSGVVKI